MQHNFVTYPPPQVCTFTPLLCLCISVYVRGDLVWIDQHMDTSTPTHIDTGANTFEFFVCVSLLLLLSFSFSWISHFCSATHTHTNTRHTHSLTNTHRTNTRARSLDCSFSLSLLCFTTLLHARERAHACSPTHTISKGICSTWLTS